MGGHIEGRQAVPLIEKSMIHNLTTETKTSPGKTRRAWERGEWKAGII
jgi:hypothetical protein